MARISSSTGLVSGIDTKSIIDQLISLDSQPITILKSRITSAGKQKSAFTDLATKFGDLKTVGDALAKPSTFQAANTTSSDEKVLTATAANGASTGSFQFQVARLVSNQQAITKGFADPNQTKVGAGTITIEAGGGEVKTQTLLASLNGGAGVGRGTFRVTDRAGKAAAIDITNAVTLDDVAKKINTSLDIGVRATVGSDGLVLTDTTGQTTGEINVQDLGDGTAAADLGIAGSSTNGKLTGADINYVGRDLALSQLNDGRGVDVASAAGGDFRVLAGDGSAFDVSLVGAKTVGDVIDAINTASGGTVTAGVDPGSNGITLTDHTAGGGALVVASLGSNAAKDLGLTAGGRGTLQGTALLGGIDSVLLSSLHGGRGLTLGQINVTDRAGNASTVDLAGAQSVSDVLAAITAGTGGKVVASLNASGNGIQLVDKSGGTGNLVVGDVNSTAAADLGIAGTFDATKTSIQGANLQRQWVTNSTLLKDYNGGKGVTPGKFRITASNGQTAEVDLTSSSSFNSIGDIIKTVNARGIGVTASINANGDGLLLTDTAGGTGALKVENLTGTTASDLNIAGAATNGAIDGSLEKTITVDANDTLTTVQQKIQALGFGVTASIINDGTGATPYRLSLNAVNSGRDGRFVFDGGTTGLATRNLVEAQDAAVFVGGADTSQPLLVTSSSNEITNVIKGVTIDLHGVSSAPVTLNVTRDSDSVATQLQKFTDGFNAIVTQVTSLTSYDTTTNTAALLLGDATTQSIQDHMYAMLTGVVKDAGRYRTLGDIGITVGDGAKLSFDAAKFKSAYATDPTAVQNLFAETTTGLGTLISGQVTKLTDPVNGIITQENSTLDQNTRDFQSRVDELNALLDQKRTRLETQFANMESVLAGLQSQQAALGSLSGIAAPSTSSTKSSSSSSSSSGSSTAAA